MSEQDGTQAITVQQPANDDKEAWKAYWKVQGQEWRTEPEIDTERQQYLTDRRSIIPDIYQGIYPFKDIKLSRADVEWLLATHENGRGPVDWSDPKQRTREGLDLRGAILSMVDLSCLPLAHMHGGLGVSPEEWSGSTRLQRKLAAVHLEEANLWYAHLEGAYLGRAHLNQIQLKGAHLERASLRRAYMERAYLLMTHLEGADLGGAHLEAAFLSKAHLEGKCLSQDYPDGLPAANLREAFLDAATTLEALTLGDMECGFVRLADIRWNGANLALTDWSQVKMLGDEYEARQVKQNGKMKEKSVQLNEHQEAVRANRQLAVALQVQGLNEDASRFAYRAQLMQRKVFRYQRKFGQYLFSLFLDLLTGYGYKPWRSFVAYLLVITAFATAYFIIGHTVGPVLSPLGSFVFSMTSFHGRGFFPGGIGLDDPLTVLAALEAFIGLLIEVTFIATLTQRLFGK